MKCPKCNLVHPQNAIRCDCGFDFSTGLMKESYVKNASESRYGHQAGQILPRNLQKWNWGAFCLNWIWGLSNGVYISLLCFVPVIGFAMPFVLGAKGNEWAYSKKKFKSDEAFFRSQRAWSIWGIAIFSLSVLLMIISFILVPLSD